MTKYNFEDEDRPRKFDPERKNRKTEDQEWRKEYEEYLDELDGVNNFDEGDNNE